MSWITGLFRGGCALCEPLGAIMTVKNSEIERLGRALADARAANTLREMLVQDSARAERIASELDRVKASVIEATGAQSLDEAIGAVHGWRSWSERGPELARENALLRDQLRSVAFASMATVDMMHVPLCDKPKPTRTEN